MALVTINGQPGGGGRELGAEVARLLGVDLVDQRIMVEAAAQRLGATVEALPTAEFYSLSLRDRLGRVLQRALQSSALASGTDLTADAEVLLARPYAEAARAATTAEQEVNDRRFLEVTRAIMREIATHGNAVILGRASNIMLRDIPGCLHVGIIAPLELRVRNLMERESLGWTEAHHRAGEDTHARVAFFHKFFKLNPDDPKLYDVMLNMERLNRDAAAQAVAQMAQKVQHPST